MDPSPYRTHTHSHRCRRHAGDDAVKLEQQIRIHQLQQQLASLQAQQAAANAPPPTTLLGKIMHEIRPITSVVVPSLIGGLMMGAGTLITRYLWGRFIAHDIPPGEFVPRAHGQKVVVDSVDASGHPGKLLVEAIDTTKELVSGALSGVASAGLAPTMSAATADMAMQPVPQAAHSASVAASAAPSAAGGGAAKTGASSK